MLSSQRSNYPTTAKMEIALVFFLCVVVGINAQLLNPISTMGMTSGWGNPIWHSGIRYPGMMQTSQVNSMTYPTWRSHPIFRMSSDKNLGSNVPSDVINVPKVPSNQEVLTHMALVSQNPKPYLDIISDFFYEPQKARTVLSPVSPAAPVSSIASAAPVGSVATLPSVAPIASAAPVYMQGLNLMRAAANIDDCVQQDGTRWERGMDWLY